jgi:hypothetical protein
MLYTYRTADGAPLISNHALRAQEIRARGLTAGGAVHPGRPCAPTPSTSAHAGNVTPTRPLRRRACRFPAHQPVTNTPLTITPVTVSPAYVRRQ